MKPKDIQIGGVYMVKLDGKLQLATVMRLSEHGGWIIRPHEVDCERRIPLADVRKFRLYVDETGEAR